MFTGRLGLGNHTDTREHELGGGRHGHEKIDWVPGLGKGRGAVMSETLNQLSGLPLFKPPPPPPTGPEGEGYTKEDSQPPAFIRLLETDRGKEVWSSLEWAALQAHARGERRFSIRGFLDTKKVSVNNAFAPWFADLLVATHPPLLEIIERRKRTRSSPVGEDGQWTDVAS